MLTQFGEFEDTNEKALKIVAKGPQALSKNQQLFNKLTKRIETLEAEIINENENLSQLLEIHNKEISPLQTKIAHLRVKLAVALSEAIPENKFTKKQVDRIREVIVEQCEDAFRYIEPDPQQEAFYDNWAEISYKESTKLKAEATKEMFADSMRSKFGMDVDIDSFDHSPEGFARFHAKMKDQFEQSQQEQKQTEPQKSKKQQVIEDSMLSEESMKVKTLRSIYIALAKVMHPDTEADEFLKAEKEEIMKHVTAAYEQKNLSALLKLEIEWVHKTSEHLEKLTNGQLKIYILALRQQVTELESELFTMSHHNRYAAISGYSRFPFKKAIFFIKKAKSDLKNIFLNLKDINSSFRRTMTKKQILQIIGS